MLGFLSGSIANARIMIIGIIFAVAAINVAVAVVTHRIVIVVGIRIDIVPFEVVHHAPAKINMWFVGLV